jgi:hypothetical protein
MNVLDQMLENRAQRVLKNADGESNRTLGLETPSVFTDRVVGPSSTANASGIGERDRPPVFVVTAMDFDTAETPHGLLCRRERLSGGGNQDRYPHNNP